jgi:hypothetical protein
MFTLQSRIDGIYEDKLDCRIGIDYCDAKAAELRALPAIIMCDIQGTTHFRVRGCPLRVNRRLQ